MRFDFPRPDTVSRSTRRNETVVSCRQKKGCRKLTEFMTGPQMPVASAFSGMFHTAFDGLFFSARCQQRDRLTTLIGQAMAVEVKRRAGGAVAQERTYRLNIYTQLQQPCGKAVTKGMEMNIR